MTSEKKGPFRILEEESAFDSLFRNYECVNYQNCLSLAAALDWDGFKCNSCSGQIEESLYWQVRQVQKKDKLANELCDLPEVECLETSISERPVLELLVKPSVVNEK